MLWKHKPKASFFRGVSSSPKRSTVLQEFNGIQERKCFSFFIYYKRNAQQICLHRVVVNGFPSIFAN